METHEPEAARTPHVGVSAVAAIQTGLDSLAGDVLDEVLLPERRDFLHPQDLQALQREQRRRGVGCKVTQETQSRE